MKNVIGVIFADSIYTNLGELTAVRPLAALPVNGRYRIIDFVLSTARGGERSFHSTWN